MWPLHGRGPGFISIPKRPKERRYCPSIPARATWHQQRATIHYSDGSNTGIRHAIMGLKTTQLEFERGERNNAKLHLKICLNQAQILRGVPKAFRSAQAEDRRLIVRIIKIAFTLRTNLQNARPSENEKRAGGAVPTDEPSSAYMTWSKFQGRLFIHHSRTLTQHTY